MPRGKYKHYSHQGYQKGYNWSTNQRKNCAKSGWHHSEKTKEKIRQIKLKNPVRYWLGKKRLTMMGEKNPRWTNKIYKKQYERNDSAYREWVKQVKKRDKGRCRINNKDCSGYLIVHHILPVRTFPELMYEINNGITLCQAHHPLKRAEEKRLIPEFQQLVGVSKI
jgi:hypothetical protein